MRPGEALRLALRDFYGNSWRLLVVNTVLGAALVAAILAALAFPLAGLLVIAVGPLAAALVHCAVTLVRTGDLELADALDGLRLHWRRGLALAVVELVLVVLAVVALRAYGGSGLWPLAFLSFYVFVLLGIYGLVVWTLAVAEPSRPLRAVAREAADIAASRPGALLVLGLALVVVNVVGIAAAVMPFLTLTIAYTFLAVAHFVLPSPTTEETV
jgi:hypothetical protein